MKKGFTLIELIVVVVVLGILAAIVVPNISDFSKEAKETSLEVECKTVESAIDRYAIQNSMSPEDVFFESEIFDFGSIDYEKMVELKLLRDVPSHEGMMNTHYITETGELICDIREPDAS